MNKHSKLCDIVAALAKNVPSRSITVKVRTGWDDKNPTTHKLMPLLQKCTNDRIAAIFVRQIRVV
jgi:tRNA-dihydrouridine synthase